MKAIFGLGNLEDKYENTRHNIGFVFLDWFLGSNNLYTRVSELPALVYKKGDVIYVRPSNYMNNSGECVKKIMHYYKILPEDILVIHDDIDQKIGLYKYVENGGSGGHNGIKDIIEKLGTDSFKRIKIGVAPEIYNPALHKAGDFVLKNFSREELEILRNVFEDEVRVRIERFADNL